MLLRMEVYSSRATAPELPLGSGLPALDPIQIKNIDGLDPVDASINTTKYGTIDGESYQGSSVGKRNIVLTLGLNPDYITHTYASLRKLLYAYFTPKASIKLRFISDDMPTVDIEGYVETNNANIFTQDPELQVSILCPMPDFVATEITTIEGAVGDLATVIPVEYNGDSSTGFMLTVAPTPGVPTYSGPLTVINDLVHSEKFQVPIVTDAVTIYKLSTLRRQKSAKLFRITDGATTNLLGKMTADSVWPALQPGLNQLRIVANTPGQQWTLSFYERFGGL